MSYTEKQYHILNVAERLFAQKGFDGTSVRDIAEEAGVNIAMISYYFGSKEKLMQTLFEERTSQVIPKLEQLLKNETLTSFQKVEILIEDHVNRAMQKLLFYKILVCEQMLEKNQVITGLIRDLKKKNAELLEKLIEEGQKNGSFRKDVDVILMSNTLIGAIIQTFINQEHYRDYYQLEKLSDTEFRELLTKKLSSYIKGLFKTIISDEA